MASDLSTLIQESISGTLNGSLGKEVTLKETTKVHELDIKDSQVIQVNAVFDFDKISSTISFVIPAVTASCIFNIMMGDSSAAIIEIIDDDTQDAMKEFVSNLSGTLTTTINAASFEDLGSTKFNIAKSEVKQGSSLVPYENMFRFQLNIDAQEVLLFLQVDQVLLPYIESFLKLEITKHEEPVVIEDIKEDEPIIEDIKEEPKIENQPNQEKPKEEDNSKEEKKEEKKEEDPKEKKMKLIIMGLGGLIGFLLLVGIVMYFMGVFDEPEPVVVPDANLTKKAKKDEVEVVTYKTLKKVNFKVKDIDINRLNGRLLILNKNNVLTKEALINDKKKEQQRLKELDIEQQYIEFAKNNKEEPLKEKSKVLVKKQSSKVKTEVTEQKIQAQPKLKYLITNSLQYKLFIKLIAQTNSQTAKASICNGEQGDTVIFIGPFETDENKNHMESLINTNDSTIETKIVNLTQKQLDKYCN